MPDADLEIKAGEGGGRSPKFFRPFLKSLALDGESEQRTTTGPQISANERVNMEPSSQVLLLLTPKIGRTSISWQAGQAGFARSHILSY